MRRWIRSFVSILLAFVLLTAGCFSAFSSENGTERMTGEDLPLITEEEGDPEVYNYAPSFKDLSDKELLTYVEDSVYLNLVSELDSSEYYVEKVQAVYVSQEYLDEVAYNSQANIFFGYTLEDIEKVYEDSRFVFTLGDNGETVVEPFEAYDDTYERIIQNVAVGTGVILVCVTVSVVTAGAGAPAISMIFAASAKTGTAMALSSAAFGGVSAGIVTGIQTGSMEEALKNGALAASEGIKWGAVSGAIAGGASESVKYAKALKALKGMDLNISIQDAAAIQMETGFPADVISQFHSMEEYEVFKEAGLKATMVNGKASLIRSDIDLARLDEMGRSNLARMKNGLAPLDAGGNSYELHHIGQNVDGTLAVLTKAEHDNPALHGFKMVSEINRPEFDVIRRHFWKTMAKILEGTMV